MASSKPAKGLVLSLGNAPDTPHVVIGEAGAALPGLYRPGRATVVGGPGDPLTLEAAREFDADPGCPLRLVDVPAGDVEQLRAEQDELVGVARRDAVKFRREHQPDGAEREQVRDEIAATKPRKGEQDQQD